MSIRGWRGVVCRVGSGLIVGGAILVALMDGRLAHLVVGMVLVGLLAFILAKQELRR